MKSIKLKLVTLLFVIVAGTVNQQGLAQTDNSKPSSTLKSKGYAPVNGLKMYYEVHGEGEPLVLIHGSFMTIDLNWIELLPELAKKHKVIAFEMQGHGRTADINRTVTYTTLANDVAGLLKFLKIDSANVLGYSLGATTGLELAIKHPKLVKKLVFISSVYKHEGWIKSVRDIIATMSPEFLTHTPLKTEYDRVAPDTANWTKFLTKMIKFENMPYDLGIDNIKKIKSPILIINGDNDGVDNIHTTQLYKAIGGGVSGDMEPMSKSQLAILPGSTHVTVIMQTSQLLNFIAPFLK